MQVPSITGFYLAILALIYAVLAIQVAELRRGNRVVFGDGENIKLRSAIRAHANFIEYVPIIALLVAMLEMSGMRATWVHLLMGALLLSRLLHPLGMHSKPGTWQFAVGRMAGILITFAVLAAAAASALLRFWPTYDHG
jgi:uncharacterized membrane protein YecN with MAPEG domain